MPGAFVKFDLRTAAQFTADNPILDPYTIGVETGIVNGRETNTGKMKRGNGRQRWTALPYIINPPNVNDAVTGAQATGTLTVEGDVEDGETIDVNGVTFTFVNRSLLGAILSATSIPFHTGDKHETVAEAIATALSNSTDADVDDATYEAAGNVVYVTAIEPGTDGNAFTLDDSSNGAVVASDTALADGVDGLSTSMQFVEIATTTVIDASNAANYNGKTLVLTDAVSLTFDDDLPEGFNCTIEEMDSSDQEILVGGGFTIVNKNSDNAVAADGVISLWVRGTDVRIVGETATV
jgi:hypothetical protein